MILVLFVFYHNKF